MNIAHLFYLYTLLLILQKQINLPLDWYQQERFKKKKTQTAVDLTASVLCVVTEGNDECNVQYIN